MGGSCAQAENRRYRNPADPKVSHAQPPLHEMVGEKKRLQIGFWGRLVRLHLAGFSGPVAELAATEGRVAWWWGGCNWEKGNSLCFASCQRTHAGRYAQEMIT